MVALLTHTPCYAGDIAASAAKVRVRGYLLHTLKSTKAIVMPRFLHSKTAATRPLPIERALKTDIVAILVVCMNINIMKDIGLSRE